MNQTYKALNNISKSDRHRIRVKVETLLRQVFESFDPFYCKHGVGTDMRTYKIIKKEPICLWPCKLLTMRLKIQCAARSIMKKPWSGVSQAYVVLVYLK